MAQIGDSGTEQFYVNTEFNGHRFPEQKLHDPFIFTKVGISRWDLFKGLFRKQFEVKVQVGGSQAVMRAIMTLDPAKLAQEELEILEQRRIARETNPVMGYYAEEAK